MIGHVSALDAERRRHDAEVLATVRKVAAKIARQYHSTRMIEREDAEQEARIILARQSGQAREALSQGVGLLNVWLWQRMRDSLRKPLKQRLKVETGPSLDALDESQNVAFVFTAHSTPDGAYDREAVERLLPLIWDDEHGWQLGRQDVGDPDMPKAAREASRTHTAWACYADVSRAWERAPLTLKQRRAIFLMFAANWSLQEIAEHEGITKQSAWERINAGISKVVRWLNGEVVKNHGIDTLTTAA